MCLGMSINVISENALTSLLCSSKISIWAFNLTSSLADSDWNKQVRKKQEVLKCSGWVIMQCVCILWLPFTHSWIFFWLRVFPVTRKQMVGMSICPSDVSSRVASVHTWVSPSRLPGRGTAAAGRVAPAEPSGIQTSDLKTLEQKQKNMILWP